jgi:hypothetical protein
MMYQMGHCELKQSRFVRDKIPVCTETTNMLAITVFMYSGFVSGLI